MHFSRVSCFLCLGGECKLLLASVRCSPPPPPPPPLCKHGLVHPREPCLTSFSLFFLTVVPPPPPPCASTASSKQAGLPDRRFSDRSFRSPLMGPALSKHGDLLDRCFPDFQRACARGRGVFVVRNVTFFAMSGCSCPAVNCMYSHGSQDHQSLTCNRPRCSQSMGQFLASRSTNKNPFWGGTL